MTGEILVIAFVIVVVFSASRMSALGNALGKFVYSFKKASSGQGFVDANRQKLGSQQSKIVDAEVVRDEKK